MKLNKSLTYAAIGYVGFQGAKLAKSVFAAQAAASSTMRMLVEAGGAAAGAIVTGLVLKQVK